MLVLTIVQPTDTQIPNDVERTLGSSSVAWENALDSYEQDLVNNMNEDYNFVAYLFGYNEEDGERSKQT